MVTAARKLKDTRSLEEKLWQTRDILWNAETYFADKGPYSQSYGFSASHYGCDSWTIKKAECWRTDAFELRCWRRLLRVPWIARSHQSILKEIKPEYSLEQLMLKLQYFGHLMQQADSLEKADAGKARRLEERGLQRMRWSSGMSLSKLQEVVKDRKPHVLHSMPSQRAGHDWVTQQHQGE